MEGRSGEDRYEAWGLWPLRKWNPCIFCAINTNTSHQQYLPTHPTCNTFQAYGHDVLPSKIDKYSIAVNDSGVNNF